jgi:hypothetical protein
MKAMVCTAITVLSLGIGSAYAGDGDGNSAATLFTSNQNEQAARARTVAVQNSVAPVQTSDASDARPQGKNTWLFRVFSAP